MLSAEENQGIGEKTNMGTRTLAGGVLTEREDVTRNPAKIFSRELDMYYGPVQALHGITMEIRERAVTALIGPSGCGKSTFLRTLS